jgi:hypothetical protein
MPRCKHKTVSTTTLITLIVLAGFRVSSGAEQSPSAVAEIKKIGGSVRAVDRNHEEWEVEFQLYGRKLTDTGLAKIAALNNVVSLNLRDTKITSAGLVHLKSLVTLRRLHLERTKIDDAGVAHLKGLINLEYLNLYSTNVTDKSLGHLANLKNLTQLYVWQTKVSDKGVAKLKQALPGLKIVRGVDLSKVKIKVVSKPPKKALPLKWITANGEMPPKSKTGSNISITFENKSKRTVKVYWVSYSGPLKLYKTLPPGATHEQNSYSQATWLITDEKDKPLGHFITGAAELYRAIIPPILK